MNKKPPRERAILLGVRLSRDNKRQYEDSYEECQLLAETAGAEIVAELSQTRESPDSRTYIGEGKCVELRELISQNQPSFVIINAELSPSQQKNLEEFCEIRVIDRIGLILDIFAQRAQTQEAKLQVELAQYQYLMPRLTKMWSHFSQQGGTIGTRGPGETQLEVDRRRIGDRIRLLRKRAKEVRQHHQLLRDGRRKKGAKMIALVGYTNAGKSTLLNVLTHADVLVENMLFATLDPTVRKLFLPGLDNVVLTDTVGFIQRLPHQLVDAFKATLDEVVEADLLLHVVDASADTVEDQMQAVLRVLEEIKATHQPLLIVFNKNDCVSAAQRQRLEAMAPTLGDHVFISALKKEGLEILLEKIQTIL